MNHSQKHDPKYISFLHLILPRQTPSAQKPDTVSDKCSQKKQNTVKDCRVIKERLEQAAVKKTFYGPGAAAAWTVVTGCQMEQTGRK